MSKHKISVEDKPYNPFFDDYVQQEIEFYGLTDYDKNDIHIRSIKIFGRCDDLLNVNFRNNDFECPQFFIDGNLWMTLTQMEIQSQYLPIKNATGKVAIGGLGMGYSLLRIMEKEDVKSIDVYEQESRVVDFFTENFSDRKGFDKVNFIVGDIHEKMHGKIYDFVYVDIYQEMLPDETISDKYTFCDNNTIKYYHFWAQEKVLKYAYESGFLSLLDLPIDLIELFRLWEESKGARMRDREIGEGFVAEALASFGIEV